MSVNAVRVCIKPRLNSAAAFTRRNPPPSAAASPATPNTGATDRYFLVSANRYQLSRQTDCGGNDIIALDRSSLHHVVSGVEGKVVFAADFAGDCDDLVGDAVGERVRPRVFDG